MDAEERALSQDEFADLVKQCVDIVREFAPIDTGNLRNNAVRLVWEDENTAHIYVDQAIAPYMPYTNEPWVSKRWNGKKNPNQYWFDRSADRMATLINFYTNASAVRKNDTESIDIQKNAINLAKEFMPNGKENFFAYYRSVFSNSIYKASKGFLWKGGGK